MSRIRTKNNVVVETRPHILEQRQVRRQYTGSPPVYFLQYQTLTDARTASTYRGSSSTITDEPTYGRNRFNAVTHTKQIPYKLIPPQGAYATGAIPPLMSVPTYWNTYSKNNKPCGLGEYRVQGNVAGSLNPVSGTSIDWADLTNKVGQQLDGRMVSGQNLLVSLAEIGQAVGMLKNPMGLKRLLTGRSKLTLSQLAKLPANALLEYQFGWKNLYRDIVAISNVWQEVRKHKEYLEASADKHVPIHESGSSVATSSLSLTPIQYSYGHSYVLTPIVTRYKTIGTFGLSVKRPRQALLWSQYDQVMNRLGCRQVAEALWDLVPFSFVVDWFTHINRLVRQKSISWNSYDLRYLGYSTKNEWYCDMRLQSSVSSTYPFPYSNTVDVRLGEQLVQTSYVRVAGFPTACSSVGLFGNLSKTQIALGVALIVQRL